MDEKHQGAAGTIGEQTSASEPQTRRRTHQKREGKMEEFRLEPQALGRRERKYVKYAYSLKISRVREKDFPYYGNSIRSTKDLVKFCRSLECADIEKLVTIYLNVQNDVIGIHAILGHR
jgi:DNA repair protein RadC